LNPLISVPNGGEVGPVLGPRSSPPTPILPKPQHHRQNRLPNPKNIEKTIPCRTDVILSLRAVGIQHSLRTPWLH